MIARPLRDAIRGEPLTFALFAAAAMATLLPVWIGRYVPLLDYPNHLSVTFVWRHLSDPHWNFSPYYATHLVPLPYWVFYGVVYLLSAITGTAIAQKLFLSAALLLLPASLALYARAMGRDWRLAIFGFPLAWNYNVALGFISYAAAVPALLFSLWLLDRFATAPSWRRALAAAFAGASLYFFHILAWGAFLFMGCASAPLAPRPWRWWRSLLAPLPLLPAAALGLWAWRASKSMDVRVIPNTGGGLAAFYAIYYEPSGVLRGLQEWLLNLFPDSRDEWFAACLALIWLLLLTTRPLAAASDRGDDEIDHPRGWRLEAAALAAGLLLFKLPRTLHQPFYWFAINTRIAVVFAALAILFVRGPIAGVRKGLFVAASLLAIAFPLDVAAHFRRFNERARGFDEVLAPVPFGKRVLPLMLRLGDPDLNVNCYNQWGSYVQLEKGGYVPWNNDISFPLRQLTHIPAPPWNHPEAFRFDTYGRDWDYFLVHGPTTVDPFAGVHHQVRLVKESGDWQLWEKVSNP